MGDGLRRQRLFGLDFVDASDLKPVVDEILHHEGPEHDGRDTDHAPNGDRNASFLNAVVTPNVDILVSLDKDDVPGVAQLYSNARYVLPDGMPVVAASKLLGRPLAARLTGSGLFRELWPRLAADRRRLVMLCSNSEIAEILSAEHPDAEFVVPPYFDVDDVSYRAVIAKELFAAVERTSAEYVLVGIGHPKDALVATAMLRLCEEARRSAPLCLCLGASFAMYVGQQRRAPELVQRIGMEWFYRFVQEPRRLFRRYFVDDVAFLGLVRRERSVLHGERAS